MGFFLFVCFPSVVWNFVKDFDYRLLFDKMLKAPEPGAATRAAFSPREQTYAGAFAASAPLLSV